METRKNRRFFVNKETPKKFPVSQKSQSDFLGTQKPRVSEKSVFLEEQGDTPKNRIWSFLIVHSEYDYSMKDIARYSKVGYTTLKKIWKEFKKSKMVIQTRTVGKAKMYKLNLKNPVVEKFIDFYWAVVESVVMKESAIEGVKRGLEYIRDGKTSSIEKVAKEFEVELN